MKKGKSGADSDSSGTSSRLVQLANSTLGAGNLKNAVSLPAGEDLNEWIAYNAYEFVNQIKLVYGASSHVTASPYHLRNRFRARRTI